MQKRGLNLPKKRVITAPASLIKRFVGYFIDLFIVNIVIISPFRSIFNHLIPSSLGVAEVQIYLQSNADARQIIISMAILIGILIVTYFTYFEYKLQQTPGKMIMKNFIVPEKGKTLTIWNYLISNLTFIPFFPFFLLWIIDPIHMFFSKKNQRFMEKISNIVVMEKYEVL